ncbi:4-hydroxybenzoate polyprenyltransferase [Panacagrimonas perspica]|uniref:4-hydroxybenzoate octaprenyltransferase n=1 Tax=Panacagrimonas perspica TaxID=381431 RepID=A0A4V3URR4_9GAMM|nr:4-hydroxybenzoate octaprenyltransferase [Panacagrimonas perspica]TDU26564.1 4-hydroxybenzoate polyprenyltransferase [Panacagrimonas perspica]THD03931.1 4-hydroxybenzoate polyprenyltransferase [Panacagrimonas perspica]
MPSLKNQLPHYWRLMRFHRPIGIWLLLWPTLWALWFAADGPPPLHVFVVFALGTVLMRAAGCVINDFADRDFDPHVARTLDRPLAAGLVTTQEALRLFVITCVIAFCLVLSLGNPRVLALSLPAVGLAALYPFTKRWISMPQAVLSLAFSWGIPMAFAAVLPAIPWNEVLCLMAANVCWVIAYDTFYAMADREDDRRIGVKSSALFFGDLDRPITALLQVATLALLAWAGRDLGAFWFGGLAIAAGLAVQQQWSIRTRDPQACFRAFLANHYFGAVIFLGLAFDRMLLS